MSAPKNLSSSKKKKMENAAFGGLIETENYFVLPLMHTPSGVMVQLLPKAGVFLPPGELNPELVIKEMKGSIEKLRTENDDLRREGRKLRKLHRSLNETDVALSSLFE